MENIVFVRESPSMNG